MMPQKLCICQICNCGRHRCPHRNEQTVSASENSVPCLISEYESRYTGDMAERARSFKPTNRPFRPPETQMEKISTQGIDFVAHPLHKTDGFKPHRQYAEPTVAMDLKSTYNSVYFGTPGERQKSYKPTNRAIGGGQFRWDVTSDGGSILQGDEEYDRKSVSQSQSQDDYRGGPGIVARPVRVRRRFSDQVLLGQDSPTYYSTNHSSYQGLPGQAKLGRKMADGVDQSVDHVILGTSASPGHKMVSTNHADYLKYPIMYKKHQVQSLNKSGFVLGEDETFMTFTSNQDHFRRIDVIPSIMANKVQHQDLFRSSAGLLFGQSSARYITQSQQDYPSHKDAIPSNRRRAKLNKEQAQSSAAIIFGQGDELSGGGGKTTSNDAYGQMKPVERVLRNKRNLFQPTEGFSLSYEGEEEDQPEMASPRYSSVSRGTKKHHGRREIELERREVSRQENDQPGNQEGSVERDLFSGHKERQRKRRHKRSQRGGSRQGSKVSSALTSQRHRTRSGASTRMTFSQLADEMQNIRHATLDSNGLLWFPVNEENGRRKGLPKWAETALKDNSDKEEDHIKQSSSNVSGYPGNYAKQNDQIDSGSGKTGMLLAEKISIPPSSSDEGLVLDQDGSSLINLLQSDEQDQRGKNIATAFSIYSPDSMESGRQSEELLSLDGYDSLDNLDSLERARSRSPSRSNENTSLSLFLKSNLSMESDPGAVDSGNNQSNHQDPEESSILERTRDKMRIPKLIPFPHHDMEVPGRQTFNGQSEPSGEERNESSPLDQLRNEATTASGQKDAALNVAPVEDTDRVKAGKQKEENNQPIEKSSSHSAHSLPDGKQQIMPQSNSQENGKEENIPAKTQQLLEKTSMPADDRPVKNHRSQLQKASPSNQKQIQSIKTQAVNTVQSLSPTSLTKQGRKGRRAMANTNSQRNQYPRSTSLGGLMQQGYREQMTTSQNAYPPQQPQLSNNQPTPKPRFQKRIPISEDGQFIMTTSRPLQHSPPSRQSTSAQIAPLTPLSSTPDINGSFRNSPSNRKSQQQTLERHTKNVEENSRMAGDTTANSNSATPPLQQTSNRKRRPSLGQSHQMPANWQPTRPFRYADTLRLFDGDAFDQLSTQKSTQQQDYQGIQLAQNSIARPQSLDRKGIGNEFSRPYSMDDLEESGGIKNGRRQRNRSHDVAPQDYAAIFAQHRRVPFIFKDHDIFQTSLDRNKFDGRTETSEAFKKWEEMAPRLNLVRPSNQLQLFDGKGTSQLQLRSVTQDMYHEGGDGRPPPFRPQAMLNIFAKEGAVENATRTSTSQDAYKITQKQQPRRQALRPHSALSGMNALVGDVLSPSGRPQNDTRLQGSTHAAGVASRIDSLPPVRGAVSLSSRSFDWGRVPFSSTTTNHADYRDPGSVVRPALFRQYSSGALRAATNSKVSQSTTSNTAFKKYSHQEHLLPILPQENHLFATKDQFTDRTTNKDTYQNFQFQTPIPGRNRSLPPPISPRSSPSYSVYQENIKERSRFATRTTNMDSYQFPVEEGAQFSSIRQRAAGLRSSVASIGHGEVFEGPTKMNTNGHDILAQKQTVICPAEKIISGQGKWTFAGENQGHDYYNLDS